MCVKYVHETQNKMQSLSNIKMYNIRGTITFIMGRGEEEERYVFCLKQKNNFIINIIKFIIIIEMM